MVLECANLYQDCLKDRNFSKTILEDAGGEKPILQTGVVIRPRRRLFAFMVKERWWWILVLFLLLQLPLSFFFAKRGSFDDLKGKIVLTECLLIVLSCLIASLWNTRRETKAPLSENPCLPVDMPTEKEVEEEESVFPEDELKKNLLESKGHIERLERELVSTKRQLEEKLLYEEVMRTQFPKELFDLMNRMVEKVSRALYSQLEENQEIKRQHAIEMRALLKKEGALPYEKKSGLACIPRGPKEPYVMLNMLMIFAEKLSEQAQDKKESRALVRRKFFDEVRCVKNLPCICLSLESPGETLLSDSHTEEEMKKVVEWIRSRRVEEAQGNVENGERVTSIFQTEEGCWIVTRLNNTFFGDIFFAMKESKA